MDPFPEQKLFWTIALEKFAVLLLMIGKLYHGDRLLLKMNEKQILFQNYTSSEIHEGHLKEAILKNLFYFVCPLLSRIT